MTEFWMGVGMIAGAPVFGFVSALLAVAPIYWALGRVLKKMPEEDREALQKPPCQAGWNKNVLFGFS